MSLPDPIRLALGTLSALPVPPPRSLSRLVAGRAMVLAPLAALVPALAAAVVTCAGSLLNVPPLVTGALTVGALALATSGMHLDGLADTADGLAAGVDRQRALAVMRSGDVGPAGVVTLVLVALVQASAVADLTGSWRGIAAVAVAVVCSRSVLALCCTTPIPSARPTGLGATVAGTVPAGAALVAVVLPAAIGAPVLAGLGQPWWSLPLAVAVGLAGAGLLLRRCVRRLGGVTGDVLGACVEITLTGLLVVLATTG